MAFIKLGIETPNNDAAFTGIPTVTFQGRTMVPAELPTVPLYYRWYSSLNTDVREEKYSMNNNALTAAEEVYTQPGMGMGSHVITFAVSDRQGETDDDFNRIQHGGVTGGLIGEHPCVIHIFKANIISPQDGGNVSRTSLVLKAEAPWAWSDPEYQKYNRLCYRWVLEPMGDPVGRPTVASTKLGKDQLVFDNNSNIVSYPFSPLLPATATGQYRISLFVVDKEDPEIGKHQAVTTVTLT